MRFLQSVGVVTTLVAGSLVVTGVGGCNNSGKTNGTPSKMTAHGGGDPEAVRKSLMENPDARVGVVLAALPEKRFVSVGQVPVEDFHVGDTVTFMDGGGAQIATGQVVTIGKT